MGGEGDIRAEVCALGFWTEMSVAVVRLPTLKIMDKQLLGGSESDEPALGGGVIYV